MFRRVSHENTQIQKHTNTQIHKYTNTLWTESEDRHDMCYIFEKLMLRALGAGLLCDCGGGECSPGGQRDPKCLIILQRPPTTTTNTKSRH